MRKPLQTHLTSRKWLIPILIILLISIPITTQDVSNNEPPKSGVEGSTPPPRPPSPDDPLSPVDMTMLRSFWRGEGVAVPYPGKLLLTSDKLKRQRGRLTSYDSIPLHKDFFTIDLELNFNLTNEESNQAFGLALTEQVPWAQQAFEKDFDFKPFGPNFKGMLFWIQDFQTLHSGGYESTNFNEEEILSRGKVCKISARTKGVITLSITFKLNTLSVYLVDKKDGSMRRCAQFPGMSFPEPVYFTLVGADDYGNTQTIVGIFFLLTIIYLLFFGFILYSIFTTPIKNFLINYFLYVLI